MFKRLWKNERGLTLIELLAVVVILGIIAGIAVPQVGDIINDSKRKAVITEAINIISSAKIAYANNDYIKPSSGTTITWKKTADTTASSLTQYINSSVAYEVTFDTSTGEYKIKEFSLDNISLKSACNEFLTTDITADVTHISEASLVAALK